MPWTDPPADWSNGEIVTNTKMNTHVRDQFMELWHRVAYVEFAADVTPGIVVEGSAVDVVSAGAIAFPGYPVAIEFYAPGYRNANSNGTLSLWDSSTDLGRLTRSSTDAVSSSVHVVRYLTPTAATHTYKVRIWSASASAAVFAGAGGTGTMLPGFIAIWQKGGA